MLDRYNVFVGGDPKGLKAALGELIISDVTEEQLIPIVMAIVNNYINHAKGKEKFSRYVNRVGITRFKGIANSVEA
ncbi:hypothetical protein [Paenibacillus silvisoli]|uniref:hypothetical protein n=1 Tax=Paenibacillus silvisoli TaxID=3110539 RepID=UPI002805CB1A|nr:hypothetical protein [Paenibacillus silvisoli]